MAAKRWVVPPVISAVFMVFLEIPATLGQATSNDWVGHWIGSLSRESRDYAVTVDIFTINDRLSATLDLPEYSVYGCPTNLHIQQARMEIRAKLVEAELTGQLSEERITGIARLFGKLDATITLRRASRTPTTYNHEDLRFKSGDAVLVGTLVKPPGRGPFPIIIWTHGSGPDTRKTFYYHGKAHLLAQHGVASLIYDKRGAGESTGSDSWDAKKLKEDAIAAITAIRDREDVDSTRIGIAGFSQGGWIAPAVTADSSDVAFVLVGATPGITGGEQNLFTLRNRLVAAGFEPSIVEESVDLMKRLYQFYQTGNNREAVAASLEVASEKPWYKNDVFQRHLFMPDGRLPAGRHPYWQPFSPDPLEPWRQIQVPVLSVWGELDRNVPAALSKERIGAALRDAGNSDNELIIFPSASHGLWVVRSDEAAWDWPRQAPGYHDTMVRWVARHVSPKTLPSDSNADRK